MKNCCNCCKCCCQNKCCNKKDDEAIKIDVEKEIERFTSELKTQMRFSNISFNISFNGCYVRFEKKIKNTPTIEVICKRSNSILYYIEDCLTSNHRDFSLVEKIEAINDLNNFIRIRTEKWFIDIKNAIIKCDFSSIWAR